MRIRFAALALGIICADAALATQVEMTNVVQLSGGSGHACALTTAGGAKCWGSNGKGQLGAGPAGPIRTAATDVSGLTSGVVWVEAARGRHSCAVLSGGGVKCWGDNSAGQLGDGTTIDRPTPVAVQGLPWPAVAVAGGRSHTCALSNAGAVACWGSNSSGQLGNGTFSGSTAPAQVVGLSTGVASITAGFDSTCAILDAGTAKCWGSNDRGELGDGTTQSRNAPVNVFGLSAGVRQISIDGVIAGPSGFGERYACAVMVSGTVKCWGSAGSPTPSDVAGISDVSTITVGAGRFPAPILSGTPVSHYCVSTASGAAKCWGHSYGNALGTGGPDTSGFTFGTLAPPAVDVLGLSSGVISVVGALQGFSSPNAGFNCALLTDGHVKCWGDLFGSTPVAAMEGTTPQSISLSSASRSIFTGGSASVDALGNGNPISFTSLTPGICSVSAPISHGSGSYFATVTALAAGTCTIAADQAGDAYFDPAVRRTLDITIDPHLAQTITVTASDVNLYENGVVFVQATASSGLPVTLSMVSGGCSLSGNLLYAAAAAAGSFCSVHANQAGNATYAAAPEVVQDFLIKPVFSLQTLAVYKFGGGAGTVASLAPAIDCGATCTASLPSVPSAAAVTLTATPAPGSTFAGWTGACSGAGVCNVSMNAAKSVGANFASATPRVANLSTRGRVAGGNEALIAGFVIGGASPKTVIVTATGPSLCALGVANCLQRPTMQLFRFPDNALIADSLVDGPRNVDAIQAMGFGVAANEVAMLATLAPGAYTAVVQPTPGIATGVGLVGVYEIDAADTPLIDVSTRGLVLGGDEVLIGGFVIQGNGPQTVVVRGRGPSMIPFGVTNTLPDPVLRLVRVSDGAEVANNDDWQQAANASDLIASGFAPTDAKEAAVLITLPPGAYTAIVSGAGGTTGVGAVDVFRVP